MYYKRYPQMIDVLAELSRESADLFADDSATFIVVGDGGRLSVTRNLDRRVSKDARIVTIDPVFAKLNPRVRKRVKDFMIAKDAFRVRYAPLLKEGPVVMLCLGAHVNAGALYAKIKGETRKGQSTYAVVAPCCKPGLRGGHVKAKAYFCKHVIQFSFPGTVPLVCPLFAAALMDSRKAFQAPETKPKKRKRKTKNTATIREATTPSSKRRKR